MTLAPAEHQDTSPGDQPKRQVGATPGELAAPLAEPLAPAARQPASAGDQLEHQAASPDPGAAGDQLEDTRPPLNRAWLVLLAAPAFVAIWGGWVGLGSLAGFGPVVLLPGIADNFRVNLAVTLPAGMEIYAALAFRVWLSSRTRSERTRRFAMLSSIAALAVGSLGQVAYHVLARPETGAPMLVTVFVACLPVAILGAGAALFHMLSDDRRQVAPAGGR